MKMIDIKARGEKIELLEQFGQWLEKNHYLDTDWRTEEPFAIDAFLKTFKPIYKMHADLVGALEQIDTSWKAFEHKGKPMTKEEVRRALVYGIRKGYRSTGELTDDDVDNALKEEV